MNNLLSLFGEKIPIVDDELRKASGEVKDEMLQQNVQKLVTADGTYATQSAFSTIVAESKTDERLYFKNFEI